jgi:uncharacterized protein YegP (UPF0339 family)
MAAQFELLRDDEDRYWFRLKAANGEVVAESQTYRSIADARTGMVAVQRAAAEATVPDDDAGPVINNGIHMHY